MKALVGEQNLLQGGARVCLRRNDRNQLLDLIVTGGLRQFFRRVTFQQLAVFIEIHDVADRNGRNHEALAANPGQPVILHQAGARFADRGAAGSASLGKICFGEELARRQLGRDQPIAQNAVNTLDFTQLVGLDSGWFRQYQVTMYAQRILSAERLPERNPPRARLCHDSKQLLLRSCCSWH